jgi:ribose/xylose/arabinose/galactoside ABC-type transport system permease subunit
MQKLLITIGVLLVILGLLWPLLQKSGLGRLPGDIAMEKENFKFYFPITTSIIISIVLSLILWLFMRK